MDCLIGSTGFVGGHLDARHAFDARLNSKTISQAFGCGFDLVVCAAAPGSMFQANRFPERDKQLVDKLIDQLSRIKAERFVLISSIAVLADFAGCQDETTTSYQQDLAYGRNRRALEIFCLEHFANCLTVRLPALFGNGLQKNFIFDILNPMPTMLTEQRMAALRDTLPTDLGAGIPEIYQWDETFELYIIDRHRLESSGDRPRYDAAVSDAGRSAVRFTHPHSQFQYYAIADLWSDIQKCLHRRLDVVHIAPEPLVAGTVYMALTGEVMPESDARVHQEDMRTRHAELWGLEGPYCCRSDETLGRLKKFYNEQAPVS